MDNITVLSNAKPVVERDLSSRLMDLQRFGKPTIGVYGDGGKWHASIDMSINVRGGQFKIATDFNRATPADAVSDLEAKVKAALRELQASISTALSV